MSAKVNILNVNIKNQFFRNKLSLKEARSQTFVFATTAYDNDNTNTSVKFLGFVKISFSRKKKVLKL